MSRRRHDDEEQWVDDEPTSAGPVEPVADDELIVDDEQPAIVAPAAFAWNAAQDRRNGTETYVERAYRGPTPDNPSLSLKKRLKRAAFMDKRQRDVAAGHAVPVDPMAGLPDRVANR